MASRIVASISAIVVIATLSFSVSNCYADPWGQKLFSETHHDFGTVSRNAKTEYAFVIENVYDSEIHIAGVRSSCGCTKPVLTKTTLKPKEKGEVIAQFNTRTFIGARSAMITVVIDRPYYSEVQLTVGGTIRADVVVDPGEVRFGDVDTGTSKTVDLKISYAGRRDWKIVDVRGNCESIEVRLDPAQRTNNVTSYVMHVKLTEDAPIGDIMDELIVVTDDAKDDQFVLPLSARVMPPVSVSPSLVALGDIPIGQNKQQRFVVRSKKPFAIKQIDCDDERFEFMIPEGEKTVHVVSFNFVSPQSDVESKSVLRQKVLIKTSLGEEFVAETTIAGRVIH